MIVIEEVGKTDAAAKTAESLMILITAALRDVAARKSLKIENASSAFLHSETRRFSFWNALFHREPVPINSIMR